MNTILFYYPSNLRTNVLESQMIALKRQGNRVLLLTIAPKGHLHTYLEEYGVEVFSQEIKAGNRLMFYFKSIKSLVKFSKEHNVDTIYCHLQQANFIGVLAQNRLEKVNIITCRHHHDRVQKGKSRTARFFDQVINKRAKKIIVPSRLVYEQVTIAEKVDSSKVFLIPYTYDFSLFAKPDPVKTGEIRKQYPHHLLAITLSRLVDGKGLEESLEIVGNLTKKGIDIGLIIAGEGELRSKLEQRIRELEIASHVHLVGHVYNPMDYMAASDFMLLLSDNEASNNAVKEAAFCGKTSIVCSGVGDFDDYMVHEGNGFIVSIANKINGTTAVVEQISRGTHDLTAMGKKLREAVMDRFSIEKIILTYDKFHS